MQALTRWLGAAVLYGTLGACSLQVSDTDELGPRRTACEPSGACRPCVCPGYRASGYQLCNARGEFVNASGQLGCTCPPPQVSEVPAACGGGTAGQDGR